MSLVYWIIQLTGFGLVDCEVRLVDCVVGLVDNSVYWLWAGILCSWVSG